MIESRRFESISKIQYTLLFPAPVCTCFPGGRLPPSQRPAVAFDCRLTIETAHYHKYGDTSGTRRVKACSVYNDPMLTAGNKDEAISRQCSSWATCNTLSVTNGALQAIHFQRGCISTGSSHKEAGYSRQR